MDENLPKLKQMLQEMLAKRQEEKAQEETTRKVKTYEERNEILTAIGADLGTVIGPYLDKLKENSSTSAEELKRIISEAVHVEMPAIDTSGIEQILSEALANIKIPTPVVNVTPPRYIPPAINIPPPEINFPSEMSLKPGTRPFPVMMMDQAGKPMMFPQSMGASGGRADFFTIKDIQTSAGSSIVDQEDGALKVVGSLSTTPFATYYASDAVGSMNLVQVGGNNVVVGGGFQDNALRVVHATDAVASVSIVSNVATLDTIQVSGSISSTNLQQIAGNTVVVGAGFQDNALRVVHATDAIASVNIVGNIAALDIKQVSGSTDSVYVNNPSGQGDNATALRIIHAGDAGTSVSIIGNIATLDTIQVSGSISSTNIQQVGGNTVVVGTGYQDNALRVVHATDAIASIQAQAIGRTTNPTAVADAAAAFVSSDKLGRLLSRPMQVRELLATAYVSLTTGTETTLLAGIAATYLDLISVIGTNSSDAAVSVDLRDATGGGIATTIRIPANATAGSNNTTPYPANTLATTWTADLPDITGTTVTLSALFSKEI